MNTILKRAVCLLRLANMKAEPSHRSALVSQLLFGETVRLLDEQGEWLLVLTDSDHYEGWVQCSQLHAITPADEVLLASWTRYVVQPEVSIRIDSPTGGEPTTHCMTIAMGSRIPAQPATCALSMATLQFQPTASTAVSPGDDLRRIALMWLDTPYLWGGKTMYGADCSGFVQTLMRTQGVQLPRDAYQQAVVGEAVPVEDSLATLRVGDLMFFADYANPSDRVTHVGLYFGSARVLHASGTVHLASVDACGIYSALRQCYTHRLLGVRRVLSV